MESRPCCQVEETVGISLQGRLTVYYGVFADYLFTRIRKHLQDLRRVRLFQRSFSLYGLKQKTRRVLSLTSFSTPFHWKPWHLFLRL